MIGVEIEERGIELPPKHTLGTYEILLNRPLL